MKSKKATCHSYSQVMKELKAAGTEQNRKAYTRHGVVGDMYGVSYATLKSLDKKIAYDTDLAEKLWAAQNHDARVLACWTIEEEKVTIGLLDRWSLEVNNPVLGREFAALAAFTKHGASRSKKWRVMKKELRSQMGWSILARLAMQPDRDMSDGGVSDEDLRQCLNDIEAGIHAAPNRAKQSMNQALIAIGCRPTMTKVTLQVAKRVGPVEVDQGDTSCKTDVAYTSIKKTVAHYKARGKSPVDGSGGQRRRHC